MHTLTIPEMKEVITHIAVRQRKVPFFWGPPGCGKTAAVEQAAKEHKAHLLTILLSQYDSVDLRGFPSITEQEQVALTTWAKPGTMPFKGNPKFHQYADVPIFMFLDEMNNSTQATNAVSMQLLDKRRIGEHELMDNVVLMAAGNRESDRGVANRMATTTANRLTHFEIGVDVDSWCHWMIASGHPAASLFVAFIQFRKPLLSTFDPAKTDKAFATPRTMVVAADYFADTSMPEHIKQASMAGSIGDGPSAELWGFVDVWQKMPKMADIIANPTTVPVPDDAAMRYAVAVAVSGTMDTKNITPLCAFLERMDPEFGVLAWQLAMRRDVSISGTRECIEFSKKYRAIFSR